MGSAMSKISTNHCANTDLKPWEGTPITAALWLRSIYEHALQHGYATLLLKNYFISRNMIIVANADCIVSIKQYYMNPNQFPLPDQIQNPPNPPVPATRNVDYAPTVEEKKIYLASPELFLAKCSELNEKCLSVIENSTMQRRIRTASLGDVRLLIVAVAAVRDEVTDSQIAIHLARIADFVSKGINQVDISVWNAFRTDLDDMTFCLPAPRVARPAGHLRRAKLPQGHFAARRGGRHARGH